MDTNRVEVKKKEEKWNDSVVPVTGNGERWGGLVIAEWQSNEGMA